MNNIMMKQNLTGEQLSMVQMEMTKKQKSKGVAYALWFFLGGLGGHRYYSGDIGRAIAMTITLGGLGLWSLIDVFFIGKRIEDKNDLLEMNIIQSVKSFSNNQ